MRLTVSADVLNVQLLPTVNTTHDGCVRHAIGELTRPDAHSPVA